jgi:hypothetical protein
LQCQLNPTVCLRANDGDRVRDLNLGTIVSVDIIRITERELDRWGSPSGDGTLHARFKAMFDVHVTANELP